MSLKIEKNFTNRKLTIIISGRLDTITAPKLENELMKDSLNFDSLVIDMKNLAYISSAGLRVILKLHKELVKKSGLKLINVKDEVREVFEITGFVDFLNIE